MRLSHAAVRLVTPVGGRDDLARLGSGYGGW
jgi:hypothetical protein